MPIDHYKMTIQAKPLASLGEKRNNEPGSVFLGISRPLGHLRKNKAGNVEEASPKSERSEEKFPPITSIGLYDSDDDMSTNGSYISKDTARSKVSRTGSITPVSMSKKQVFENRYKLAAARSQPDNTKPANMYNKRVVYLPMFKINVETYIGETEDHKTVETTRQSLRQMLDKSRSKMKSPEKIALKLRDYFKQQELDNIKRQEIDQEEEHSRRDMLRVNIPKTPFAVDNDIIRIPSVPIGQQSKVDALDLTSVTDDDGISLISTKTNKTKLSDQEAQKFYSERNATPNSQRQQQFGPLYGHETDRGPQSNQYVTYADIRRMRQKGRLKVTQKTDGSSKGSSSLDHQDAKDWITIQSKPVLKYTSSQPANKGRLDPIVVPSQGCSECPMCKAAKYNKQTEPTSVPPNSPTSKRIAFSLPPNEAHEHHKNLNFSEHQSINVKVQNVDNLPNIDQTIHMKSDKGRTPEGKVKKISQNDMFPVSKVTVKMTRWKGGNLKDAKLTNSNSSSTGSINEL